MGYPVTRRPSSRCSTRHSAASPLDDLEPVADAAEVRKLIEVVRAVHVSDAVRRYAVDLVTATRDARRPAARRLAARDAAPAAGGAAPRPRSTAATTCCPTTCRAWPCRCSPTGCCSPPRHRSPGAPRGSSAIDLADAGRRRRRRAERPRPRRQLALMREAAAAGLTTRGRCFLAAGIAARSAALVLGQTRPAARRRPRSLALPLRQRCRGRPHPLPAGLRRGGSTRPGSAGRPARPGSCCGWRTSRGCRPACCSLEDHVPYILGARPRFVLDRVAPRGTREVAYPVRSDVRGRYRSAR